MTRMTREPGGQLCLANVMLLVLATGSRPLLISTWVAYERTMLAWVRTATSLITFWLQRFQILSDRERGRGATQLSHRRKPIWTFARERRPDLAGTGHAAVSAGYSDAGRGVSRAPALTGGHRGGRISILAILALTVMIFRE